jgi:hypothetical protein
MSNVRKLIRRIAKDGREVYAIPGTVTAISGTTCTVQPLNGDAELFGILLSGDDTSDILITPTIGSVVMVTMISDAEGFISAWSQVDKVQLTGKKSIDITSKGPLTVSADGAVSASSKKAVKIKAGTNATIESTTGITLNSGALGGVPIAQAVALQLNQLEIDVNLLKALIGVLSAMGSSAPGTPILAAMFAPFAAWVGKPVLPTVSKAIENPLVKH